LNVTPREGISTSLAVDLANRISGQVVIQEFIPAQTSGVTFVREGEILSEAVMGQCRTILRDGMRGVRWAADSSGQVQWISGEGLVPGLISLVTNKQLEALETMLLMMSHGYMLEWIMAEDQQELYWVDLKELSQSFISSFSQRCPEIYQIGDPINSGIARRVLVPSTGIKYCNMLPSMVGNIIICQSGSPLSHLCVAAYESRVPMIVRENE
jgi:hypothetical protein